MTRRKRVQTGYVLLMTLLLLAITATALATLGRRSFRHALDARQAVESLQRQWAVRSCEQVLLPSIELALAQPPEVQRQDVDDSDAPLLAPLAQLSIQLGDLRVDLVFADEQAKVNVNALLEEHGRLGAEDLVRQAVESQGRRAEVRLQPLDKAQEPSVTTALSRPSNTAASKAPSDNDAATDVWPPIVGFSQVFLRDAPNELVSVAAEQPYPGSHDGILTEPGLADRVTCWGNGRVNIRTAPPEVLRAATFPHLGAPQVARIVALREQTPDVSLGSVLAQLALNDRQRARMEKRLADASSCYSLWTVLSDGDRRWHHLAVRVDGQGADSGIEEVVRFRW